MISYEDFDLRLRADGNGFMVSASSRISVASEPLEIDLSRSWGLEELEKRGPDEIRQRGADLFDALIRGRIRDLYQRARGRNGGDSAAGLRIRIQFDPRDERLRPLIRLPWEIVFDRTADGGNLLAFDRRRPVVRVIDSIEQAPDPAPGPVDRVLLALFNPTDSEWLDIDREAAEVKAALAGVGLSPLVLGKATRSSLFEAISDFEPQVVHLMGHGLFDETAGEGALLLDDEFGLDDHLLASSLAASFVGKPMPRLVVLSACHTADSGRSHDRGPFSSMAVALAAAGLPAVIAMQSEVFDRNAIQFTSRLYRRLVRGDPIEAAVAEARSAIGAGRLGTLDWAAPVLFMRAPGRAPLIGLHGPSSEEPTPKVPTSPPTADISVPANWRDAIEQALREQQYSAARQMAQELPIEKMAARDLDTLRELLLRMFVSLSKTPTNGFAEYIESSRGIARSLVAQASLDAAGDARKSVSAYDEIYSRFWDLPDAAVQEQVSHALLARVELGWRSLRDPAVDAVADLILARRARSLTSAEDVSHALLVKAEIRLDRSQFTEALQLLDEVIAAGAFAAGLARARVCRAKSLAGLRRIVPALAQLSEVISTFDSLEPQDAENALDAYTLQAALLEDLNRGDEALQSLDRACRLLINVKGAASPLALRASLVRATTAERLGQADIAASEYGHVVEFASGSTTLAAYASQARRALQRLRENDASDPGGTRHVQ
jgi:tetratricopeptide (TPR) repeat protein